MHSLRLLTSRHFLKRLMSAFGFYLSWDFRKGSQGRRLWLGPVECLWLAWNLALIEEPKGLAASPLTAPQPWQAHAIHRIAFEA